MDEGRQAIVAPTHVGRLPDLVPHEATQHGVGEGQGNQAPQGSAVEEVQEVRA